MSHTIRLRLGDSLDVLTEMPKGSVGVIITDPPYLIGFMGKDWDAESEGGEKAEWHLRWLKEAYRVLEVGGVAKVFSATRTQHRLAAAMEEAGFFLDPEHSLEGWLFGSGFPKYLNTAKAIDQHFGESGDSLVTDAAKRFDGFATALKPGWEPFVVGVKRG